MDESKDLSEEKVVESLVKDLTEFAVEDDRVGLLESSASRDGLAVVRKIENIKFLDKSWADKNSTVRQTKPKVSAVSWTTKRTFRL